MLVEAPPEDGVDGFHVISLGGGGVHSGEMGQEGVDGEQRQETTREQTCTRSTQEKSEVQNNNTEAEYMKD